MVTWLKGIFPMMQVEMVHMSQHPQPILPVLHEGKIVAHVHLTLIKTGELLHLALNVHGEGTDVHLHLAATLMSEREDAGQSSSRNNHHFHHASSPASATTRHSTPANIEDLAAILQMNNLHTLKEILSIGMLSQLMATQPKVGGHQWVLEGTGKKMLVAREMIAQGKLSAAAWEHLVTTKFHHICDISEGKKWPSPEVERKNNTTGEVYLTPNFETTINDEHNRVIFSKVADLIWQELISVTLSDSLSNHKVKWNKQSLLIFAKEMYHGFKEEWKAQNDHEKAAAKNANQHKNCWSQHRKEKKKADRLMTAYATYIELHGADPIDLIHVDHMSDEASRPEDDGGSIDEWRIRMAKEKGFPADMDMDGMVFMEVVKNPWRSQQLGDIYHELFWLWKASLNPKQSNRNHPEYQAQLKEWGAWADPPGFGSAKDTTGRANTEQYYEEDSGQDHEEPQLENMDGA
ncbi:hypothetical protein BD769DRAFT_1668431 [Suillus cothurnatus]|nr:hypothetical protein BD769DRAFT_1668431 [Suillus cothurnatus]